MGTALGEVFPLGDQLRLNRAGEQRHAVAAPRHGWAGQGRATGADPHRGSHAFGQGQEPVWLGQSRLRLKFCDRMAEATGAAATTRPA
ncbi:MAG: hypothetical protein ACK55I_19310, partial [bacterium]